MGTELCPFCGKPFKRLKSHLPHCKASETSGAPPTQHEASSTQKTSSSSLSSSKTTEKKTKREKSTPALSLTVSPQVKRKTSALSAPQESVNPSSSSRSLLSSSLPLRSTSTTKKKLKLADQIKLATSTTSVSLPSSPPPSLSPPSLPSSPSLSKPKKKSLRALIEAAKIEEEESLKRTRSAPQDLLSVPTPYGMETGPSTSSATALTRMQTSPDKDPNSPQPALVSRDTKPKIASKKKVSQSEKAAKSISTNKAASASPDGPSARLKTRDKFWLDSQSEGDNLSGKLGSTKQSRITLQDVKATLGRPNASHPSSRPSILDQVKTTDNLHSKTQTRLSASPVPAVNSEGHVVSCLVTPIASSEKLPSSMVQYDSSAQTKLTPFLPPVSPFLIHTLSMNEGLKVLYQRAGLPTQSSSTRLFEGGTPPRASPSSSSSSPGPLLLPPPNLPVRVETVRSDEGLMMEKPHIVMRKRNAADNQNEGVLAQRTLGQVRLRELPGWFACKTPGRPRDVSEMLQNGWRWYYRRYLDMRKGGVGGLGMLIAGFCVLSYVWSYPHRKGDRWRKYH